MQSSMQIKVGWAVFAGCALLVLASGGYASAAEPVQAVITWRTPTAAPADYLGKLLPNRTSPINAALLVVNQGSIQSLKNADIQWFINGVFVRGGTGMSSLYLSGAESASEQLQLRAVIRGITTDPIEAEATIRRQDPSVTIQLPPGSLRASELTLTATPYFFTDTTFAPLQFLWKVNGQIRSVIENTIVLDTSTTVANQYIYVTATVSNPDNPVEVGSTERTFRVP